MSIEKFFTVILELLPKSLRDMCDVHFTPYFLHNTSLVLPCNNAIIQSKAFKHRKDVMQINDLRFDFYRTLFEESVALFNIFMLLLIPLIVV